MEKKMPVECPNCKAKFEVPIPSFDAVVNYHPLKRVASVVKP
jgi:hypothetical protein